MASLPPICMNCFLLAWNLLVDDEPHVLHVGRELLVLVAGQQFQRQHVTRLHDAQVADSRIRRLAIPLHMGGNSLAGDHGPDDVLALEVQAIEVHIGVPLTIIGDDSPGAILVIDDGSDMVQVEVDASNIDESAHCFAPFRAS